jgi:hypothetical protein
VVILEELCEYVRTLFRVGVLRRTIGSVSLAGTSLGIIALSVAVVSTAPAAATRVDVAPTNDARDAASAITAPASVRGTLDGATVEGAAAGGTEGRPSISVCERSIVGDVWYRLASPGSGRLVVRLTAARRDLDAVVTATRLTRSGSVDAGCDRTDPQGRAGLSLSPPTGGAIYLIRIGEIASSAADTGDFTLATTLAPAAPRYPGRRLPAGGARGVVDRLSNTADAWSAILHEGATYRVNLAHKPTRCAQLRIFSPAAPWSGEPSYARRCGGYLLLTPGPGLRGRWSFRVETGDGRYDQDYRLSVGPALADDMAPGAVLRDRSAVHNRLEGGRLDAVDLYRLDVPHRSHVVVRLRTASHNGFNLRLINARGRSIRCACGRRGAVQVRKGLRPGRYFVVVRARFRAHGAYTLRRVDRALTGISLRADGQRRLRVRPHATVHLTLRVRPAVEGPADVRIERFDPLSGWHFYRMFHVRVRGGRAAIPFQPPLETSWRAEAHFRGTDKASPSDSRLVTIRVQAPLTP